MRDWSGRSLRCLWSKEDGVMAEEAGRGYRDLLAPFADDVGRASGRCMQMPVLIVQISKLIARRGAGDVEMDNAGSSR
jgi:hypothetical protein